VAAKVAGRNKGLRIIFDGRQVERLDPKIARRIGPWADSPLVEGLIVAADSIIAAEARRSKMGLFVLGGILAAILIAVAIIALSYEPSDIVFVAPLYLVIMAAMGVGAPAFYRRSMARRRDQLVRRAARTAPPGTAVRLDATGLTLDGRPTPWPNIAIEAVEIVTESNPDSADSYQVDTVVLNMGSQSLVLDRGLTTNGGQILDKVLRTLGVEFH
jgi:hypothetical protein